MTIKCPMKSGSSGKTSMITMKKAMKTAQKSLTLTAKSFTLL